jgi:predicted kinase
MNIENGKYKLNPYELEVELGVGADAGEVSAQVDSISSKWQIPNEKPEHPTLLMVGGFQGSGKTTALEILKPRFPSVMISPDEIRHNLFEKGYPFSEEFTKIVNSAKFELIKKALDLGTSIIVDQSLTPDRVALVQHLLNGHSKYRLLSVFLTAPTEVLKERVALRPQQAGRYKGTYLELEASMDKYSKLYGEPQDGGYDLIIDSSVNDPQAIASLINESLSPFQYYN